jgi:hypothetical protein
VRPDGRQLVSVSLDGTVKVWDAATRQEIRPSKVAPKDVSPVAFLALAHHWLGHPDEARDHLARLRECIKKDDRWKPPNDEEAGALLAEAERRIEGKRLP